MYRILFLFLFYLVGCHSFESREKDIFSIVDKNHPLLKTIFEYPDKYELQIRYTQVNRDKDETPSFKTISFKEDPGSYFYPASTVKMPAAFLAIEKLNELNNKHNLSLNDSTYIIHHANRDPQTSAHSDSTHRSYLPSLGHYIDKLFVVSDNDAYNRVYEFLGQDYLNEKHRSKGIFKNSRIVHRVGISGFSTDDHRYTNSVDFIDQDQNVILSLPAQESRGNYFINLGSSVKGKGYYDNDLEKVVNEPFDMSKKNFLSLEDLEASLMRVIFPNSFVEEERYNLKEGQYDRIYKSMLNLPKNFDYLAQDTSYNYYDGYVKFFLFGDTEDPIPNHIKIMNKVGYAYGTLTDCAYIMDTKNGVEFFLTATILVNDNEIFNDGNYEYDEVGIPFLAELGRQIHFYEIGRDREHKPNFERLLK